MKVICRAVSSVLHCSRGSWLNPRQAKTRRMGPNTINIYSQINGRKVWNLSENSSNIIKPNVIHRQMKAESMA